MASSVSREAFVEQLIPKYRKFINLGDLSPTLFNYIQSELRDPVFENQARLWELCYSLQPPQAREVGVVDPQMCF